MSISRRRRPSLGRRRVLKRGCSFRVYEDTDLKWLWAAYRKDAFEEMFAPDLDQDAFTEQMLGILTKLYSKGSEVLMLVATIPGKQSSPVGLLAVEYNDQVAWPHAVWFPWSTARNRVECLVNFLQELNKEAAVLIASEPELTGFFGHLSRYGLLRRVGTIRKYRGDKPAILYQGVR